MSVKFVGPNQTMGPVAINTGAPPTITRGQLVRVVGGYVVATADAAVAAMAVALDKYPDDEYEGTKTEVDLALLGEDTEVELPFTGATPFAQTMIGATHNILAANGGSVNLALTAAPAFRIIRLAGSTKIGDTSGSVVGVFLDSASL